MIIEIPIDGLCTPRDGDTLTNRWWVVGETGAFVHKRFPKQRGVSPQCNSDRRVAEVIQRKLYPDAELLFIPVAYVGHHDDEWGYTMPWADLSVVAP